MKIVLPSQDIGDYIQEAFLSKKHYEDFVMAIGFLIEQVNQDFDMMSQIIFANAMHEEMMASVEMQDAYQDQDGISLATFIFEMLEDIASQKKLVKDK